MLGDRLSTRFLTNAYINNTVFAEDMADEHWQPIADVF
jgi:hypothetical protein